MESRCQKARLGGRRCSRVTKWCGGRRQPGPSAYWRRRASSFARRTAGARHSDAADRRGCRQATSRAPKTILPSPPEYRGRGESGGDSPMPDWFTPVVIILSLIALAMFVAFWTSRKTKFAGAAVLMLVLIVVVWLIARALPTDKRAIEAALNDIAAGIKVRGTDQVFANLAADFKYRTFNKSSFRQTADPHIRTGAVEELIIRNFEVTSLSRKDKKAEVEFNVHPIGVTTRGEFFLCR